LKVLIITYYWPPAGGSGVQRWLKFAKYLQDFDIEPIVYTVDNPNYDVVDTSLENEIPDSITVLKQPIFEPNNFIKKKKVATANVSSNPSFIQKSLQYIRGNYFIPDARKFWVKPSVKYLTSYLKSNPVDVVITTGPPHSMHLIGMRLKQKLGVKWLADFRDPMSNLFYNKDLLLTTKSKIKLNQLEKEILSKADVVVTVSNHLQKEFQKYRTKVEVITNGYDNEVLIEQTYSLDKKFTLSHIGLLPTQSNPIVLWQVLKEILSENEEFAQDLQLNFIGNSSKQIIDSLKDFDLLNHASIIDYVAHSEAIRLQKKSQVLLLLIPQVKGSEGIITGKVFEYITSNRPILALVPKGSDLIEIIEGTNTGSVLEFNDKIKLKTTILELYKKYKEGDLSVDAINIEQYHRKNLTKKLAQILTKL
jgi:hypothetical protein|tara:strand:+ start:1464 stop:2723 length:1260 start_codon:yes stop_codon:yes gene_type:complete